MHSLRTKITLMTAGMVIIVMAFASAFGASAIRDSGEKSASGTLLLLCEAGEKNLDSYFDQVEQSVKMVSALGVMVAVPRPEMLNNASPSRA